MGPRGPCRPRSSTSLAPSCASRSTPRRQSRRGSRIPWTCSTTTARCSGWSRKQRSRASSRWHGSTAPLLYVAAGRMVRATCRAASRWWTPRWGRASCSSSDLNHLPRAAARNVQVPVQRHLSGVADSSGAGWNRKPLEAGEYRKGRVARTSRPGLFSVWDSAALAGGLLRASRRARLGFRSFLGHFPGRLLCCLFAALFTDFFATDFFAAGLLRALAFAGVTAFFALAAVFETVLAALLAFLVTVRVAALTVLVARVITLDADFLAARPAATVFSAAPATAVAAALPADFAPATADVATSVAVVAASVTVCAALPTAVPTASAARVSGSSSVVPACSSDIDAPFVAWTSQDLDPAGSSALCEAPGLDWHDRSEPRVCRG